MLAKEDDIDFRAYAERLPLWVQLLIVAIILASILAVIVLVIRTSKK